MMRKPEYLESFLDELDSALSYGETRVALVSEFERIYVPRLLKASCGEISLAARNAQMDRKHLHDLIKKHGLEIVRSKSGTITDG
jgi:DNA-binding NtrC family response regulator